MADEPTIGQLVTDDMVIVKTRVMNKCEMDVLAQTRRLLAKLECAGPSAPELEVAARERDAQVERLYRTAREVRDNASPEHFRLWCDEVRELLSQPLQMLILRNIHVRAAVMEHRHSGRREKGDVRDK